MPRVLAIGGSDSSGGAGIQADIKTISALGGYAASALTAITAQSTETVFGIEAVGVEMVNQQIQAVLDDIGADAIKTGMLCNRDIVDAVAASLSHRSRHVPLVVDPVLISTSGNTLLTEDAVATLQSKLLPLATIATPNLPEAERLTGIAIKDVPGMRKAARQLLTFGVQAVLLKGGHLAGAVITDLLLTSSGEELFTHPRIVTRHSHGTGCTLAAALATHLAQGHSLREAVIEARMYVFAALQTAPGFGRGHGPLNHGVHCA